MEMQLAATRQDVARLAGTSPAVVSYVMNDGPRPVAPATRDRVLLAIDQLGYRPNSIARSLRMRETRTIGLVVPDNANPFFGELARAIEDAAFERGYVVLLGNAVADDGRQSRYLRTFVDQRADGIAILPSYTSNDWVAEITSAGTACVVIDRPNAAARFPSVQVDNLGGAFAAVSHLIERHGRRRVACLAGPDDGGPIRDRVDGWRLALEKHGLDSGPDLLHRVAFRRADGLAGAVELVERGTDMDAVFVTSDEQAVGALRGFHDRGVAVPGDVAVAGFDGIAYAHYIVPSLTTVARPFAEMGRQAIDLLFDANARRMAKTIVLPVELVLGESCGCVSETAGARIAVQRPQEAGA